MFWTLDALGLFAQGVCTRCASLHDLEVPHWTIEPLGAGHALGLALQTEGTIGALGDASSIQVRADEAGGARAALAGPSH